MEYPSKDNLGVVIQFLDGEGRQLIEIKVVRGDYSYSHIAVAEWCNEFRQGRESTKRFGR